MSCDGKNPNCTRRRELLTELKCLITSMERRKPCEWDIVEPQKPICFSGINVVQSCCNPLKESKSFELRASLMHKCECIKRNGLQDSCLIMDCMGRPECMQKLYPVCCPGQRALIKLTDYGDEDLAYKKYCKAEKMRAKALKHYCKLKWNNLSSKKSCLPCSLPCSLPCPLPCPPPCLPPCPSPCLPTCLQPCPLSSLPPCPPPRPPSCRSPCPPSCPPPCPPPCPPSCPPPCPPPCPTSCLPLCPPPCLPCPVPCLSLCPSPRPPLLCIKKPQLPCPTPCSPIYMQPCPIAYSLPCPLQCPPQCPPPRKTPKPRPCPPLCKPVPMKPCSNMFFLYYSPSDVSDSIPIRLPICAQ